MTIACKIKNLGCANCAAKMERKISALPGVSAARVNFMTQKLTMEAEDSKMDALVRQAADIISSIEPQARLQVQGG